MSLWSFGWYVSRQIFIFVLTLVVDEQNGAYDQLFLIINGSIVVRENVKVVQFVDRQGAANRSNLNFVSEQLAKLGRFLASSSTLVYIFIQNHPREDMMA